MSVPEANPMIEEYVAALAAALVGPKGLRCSLVAEARDHLVDASEAYARAGYGAETAAALAVRDFGTVAEVAPGFRTTLAVASSRCTAWLLLAVLMVQPLLWGSGGLLGNGDPTASAPWVYQLLNAAVEKTGAVVVVGSVVALLATGVGNRWFRAGRTVARATACFAIVAAVLVPAMALGMMVTGPGTPLALWALFVGCVVVPLLVTAAAARRTLAAC